MDAKRRHSSCEKAIAIRKEESAPRQKIPVQSGVPFPYVVGFARTGNDRLGWRGQGKIKRDEHLGDRCRHAIKSLAACCQDLPGAGLERLIVKHSREAQKVESADRIRRRLGTVVIFLHPDGNQRVAGRAAEIAASLLVPEQGRPGAPATPVPISTNRLSQSAW